MKGKTVENPIIVTGREGQFAAYIARPIASPAASVVFLQELFGVNADIRKTCDELAEKGLIGIAPDLFWRQEPGVDLGVTSEADWQHGLRLYQAFDRDKGSYPGQSHAFSRHNGLHYNAAAATLANRRTNQFLHQQLH